ncbi:type VII secretion target [Nocardia concava]|uniref:type VII secretion target n=1 Tax=Nocardia concava TaxID=257281 RepID=UPI0002E1800A|nr:type VII secretion target [Nocardia concava]
MHRISIRPDGLTASAMTTATLATDLTAITTRTATATPDLLAFGLIGTDFLTAYAAAHAVHIATLADLSAVLTGMSTSIGTAGSTYATHDAAYATALRAAEPEEPRV